MKMIAINKHSAKPKIWSVEMPNAPYLKPLATRLTKEYTIILRNDEKDIFFSIYYTINICTRTV